MVLVTRGEEDVLVPLRPRRLSASQVEVRLYQRAARLATPHHSAEHAPLKVLHASLDAASAAKIQRGCMDLATSHIGALSARFWTVWPLSLSKKTLAPKTPHWRPSRQKFQWI